MNKLSFNIEQSKHRELLLNRLSVLKQGKGSVIAISGDSGFGKSHLLNIYHEECHHKNSGVSCVYVESQSPIGKFNIGNLQPLLSFSRAIELLIKPEASSTAQKKFAKSAGLTILASLPITGEIFYAVKELGRDWREYKKDKAIHKGKKISSATNDYFDSLCSLADKTPIALLLDDMHWCDAQSVELLGLLSENINSLPILVAFSFRKNILQSLASPMLSYLKQFSGKDGFHEVELDSFNKDEIRTCCKNYFDNYKSSNEFEKWIYDNSYGVPGIVLEYLNYFQQNSPFDKTGKLLNDFSVGDYLPTTIHSAFSQLQEKLSEEEKNILSVCSSEGREFTAIIVSNLMNTDILSAIKKLRSLQNKTGIIKSSGFYTRYGVKTTTYEFAQAFYHSYFEGMLEYEERVALHGQIAALLKQKYDEAESDEIRQSIAPYIAAYSAEAGDDETARTMLLTAAQGVQKYGSAEIMQTYYDSFLDIGTDKQNEEEVFSENNLMQEIFRSVAGSQAETSEINGENGEIIEDGKGELTIESEADHKDFIAFRKTIVTYYLQKKFANAFNLIQSYLENHESYVSLFEKMQLYGIAIKTLIAMDDSKNLDIFIQKAKEITSNNDDAITSCFINNAFSDYYIYKNQFNDAFECLHLTASKASMLPAELKLLTMSNIAILNKKENPEDAEKYFDAVRKLSLALNFNEFASDVLERN